jgi:hypothetical protein
MRSWRRFIPYLDLYVDVGLLAIRTEMFNYRMDSGTRVWVSLCLRFFRAEFRFGLYRYR